MKKIVKGKKKTKSSISSSQKHRSFKLNLNKRRLVIVISVLSIITIATLVYFLFPFTNTEVVNSEIPFETEYVDDVALELGEEQTRQNGVNGTLETTYRIKRTLAGKQTEKTAVSTKTAKEPVKKTIAKGTKKFQFMWCSDGTYRYYTNEQFSNKFTGFTHKSEDFCTQTGHGHMTNVADAAPVQTTSNSYSRYTPSYTPTYRSPTTCRTQYNSYGGYFDPTATTTCY